MNLGVRSVHTGPNRDLRYAMIKRAYGPQFLQMAIAATRH